ncbi:hypothetical protein JHK85_040710 [Glycine max]|nr:hypothetical protein JHK86_040128 [Glycine max]KAG4965735.1 hypothetical protein JHK85_040710 [Glycine max]
MQTSRLTQKSDVYSFGVVLVELLTGQKALSFQRSKGERSLAMLFLSTLEKNRLFKIVEIGLLTKENEKEIKKVVVFASKCLNLKGEERPGMKEVAMELEGRWRYNALDFVSHLREEMNKLVREILAAIMQEHADSRV